MSNQEQAWMDAMYDILYEEAQNDADKMMLERKEEDYRNDKHQ